MINTERFCCTCLDKGEKLEKLSIIRKDNLSYHDKLSLLIPQMDIDEIKEMVYVCEMCKICIDNMYNFRNKCLDNKKVLSEYISQLRLVKKSKSVDSMVFNKLDGTQTRGFITVGKNDDFENVVVKTESIDDRVLPVNAMNTEEDLGDYESLNNIKEDIDLDNNFHENNSIINTFEDSETYEDIKVKKEDILPLHTEMVIGIKNYVSNNIINIQNNIDFKDITRNDDSNIDDVDLRSEGIGTNINDSTNNNGIHSGENHSENNKSLINSELNQQNSVLKTKVNECGVCNKTFKQLYYLKLHSRIHTGENLYECEICNKTFILISDYKRHSRIHTGEKPYKCEVCDKSFTFNSNYHRHIVIHNDAKSFKCDLCSKFFNRIENLVSHKRIHTGEKPYKCEKCNKSYTSSSHLKRHGKIHIKS